MFNLALILFKGDKLKTYFYFLNSAKTHKIYMSVKYYQRQWEECIEELSDVTLIDRKPSFINRQLVKDKKEKESFELFQHFAHLYIKYIDGYRKLEDCYDQFIHP